LAEEAREGTEVEDLTHALIRLGARKLIQELLEAEVTELLGRGRYARREPGQEGARNAYKPRALRCAEGRLEIDVPQVRGLEGVCQPTLWRALKRRTDVLERLVVEMYARGLSTRDIEDALAELAGEDAPLLSRSTVSRITDALHEEFSGVFSPRRTRSRKCSSQSSYRSRLPRLRCTSTLLPSLRMAQVTRMPSRQPACRRSDS